MELQQLIHRTSRRDKTAFAMLYAQTAAKLFGIAVRIVGQRQEAEEILQETFVAVWRRAGEYAPARGSAMAWLTPLDPVIQLAGPKGEAEAADFVMVMGPLVRVLPSLSAAQRENVRATLEVYFRGHATSQGVVLPAEIWVVRARV